MFGKIPEIFFILSNSHCLRIYKDPRKDQTLLKMSKSYDYLFKVLLCGDNDVGKAELLSRFVDNEIRKSHTATIGKHIPLDGKLPTSIVHVS